MLNIAAPTWLFGGWFAAVALAVAWSVRMDATLVTSALLLLLGTAPAVILLLIRAGAPGPTVAEILHAAHAKDDRS